MTHFSTIRHHRSGKSGPAGKSTRSGSSLNQSLGIATSWRNDLIFEPNVEQLPMIMRGVLEMVSEPGDQFP